MSETPSAAPALTDEQIVQRVIERDHRWRFTPIPLGVSMADYVDRRTCGCGEVFADADAHHAHVYRAVVEALYTNAPSMPDDEALEWQTRDIRDWVSFDNPDSPMGPRQFDTWYAAVVARAKRQEEKRIAAELGGDTSAERVADWLCENTSMPEAECDSAAWEIVRMLAVPYA